MRLRALPWLLLAGLALLLAYYGLGREAVIGDELLYVNAGREYLRGDFASNQEHPLLGKLLYGLGWLLTSSPTGSRIVAGTLGLLTGLIIVLMCRPLGDRVAWSTGLAWLLLPHAARPGRRIGTGGHMDRFAVLDVPAAMFGVLGLALAWAWWRSPTAPRAVAFGAAIGAAAASKNSGVLYGIAAVMGLAVLALRDRDNLRGLGARSVTHLALAITTSVLVFAGSYAVMGADGLDAFRFSIDFGRQHVADGHRISIAGIRYTHAPWWSHAWYHWLYDGPIASIFMILGMALAFVRRHTRDLVVLLATALAVIFASMSLTPVALQYYRYLWMPIVAALVGIGICNAVEMVAERRRERRRGHVVAVALLAVFLIVYAYIGSQAIRSVV